MNAVTTFSRLIARCCFWPFEVRDRRAERGASLRSRSREQVADRLRAHAAPEVDAEAVRRAEAVLQLAEHLLVVDDHLRLELLEQLPRLLEPADASRPPPRGRRPRRDSMSRYISRTFSAHWIEGVEILLAGSCPSVRRQRSFASSRSSRRLVVGAVSTTSREQAVAELARLLEVLRRRRAATSSASSSVRASLPVEQRRRATRLRCFVTAPFFEPVAFVLLRAERRRARRGSARRGRRRSRARAASAGGRRGSRRCGRARGSSSSPRS